MSQENENIDYKSTLNVARVHGAAARENPELLAASKPASLWVVVASALIALGGGSYFGASLAMGYGKYTPQTPAGGGLAQSAPVDDFAEGGKIYSLNCASCHQPAGGGLPGQFPPLDGSEWVLGSDERLAAIVLYGLSGPVTVKGQTYPGAAQMPAHLNVLNSKKIAQVLTYVRGAWSNKAAAIAPEGVDDLKKRFGNRPTPMTEGELKNIPEGKMLPKPAPEAAPSAGATPPAPAAK